MKSLHSSIGISLLSFSGLLCAQSQLPDTPFKGVTTEDLRHFPNSKQRDVLRTIGIDLNNLRSSNESLNKEVAELRKLILEMSNQTVLTTQLNATTDFFNGSNLQPKTLGTVPGKFVSALITLVKIERDLGAGSQEIGTTITLSAGNTVKLQIASDGPCSWEVYEENNNIKLRTGNCTYVARGLRGYFTGTIFYKRG